MPFRTEPEHALEANLARHGLEPADVGLVVFTHLHFDHSGLADKFPERAAARPARRAAVRRGAAVSRDLLRAVDIAKLVGPLWGQIELMDGDYEIAPGVSTVVTGGHSPGHQMVYVDVPSGQAVICGDIAYLADPGVTQGIPPGYIVSLPDALAALARVKRDARARASDARRNRIRQVSRRRLVGTGSSGEASPHRFSGAISGWREQVQRWSLAFEQSVRGMPAGGRELDFDLVPRRLGRGCEGVMEHSEHVLVLGEDRGEEPRDLMSFSPPRQADHHQRRQAQMVEVVGNLDGDLGPV